LRPKQKTAVGTADVKEHTSRLSKAAERPKDRLEHRRFSSLRAMPLGHPHGLSRVFCFLFRIVTFKCKGLHPEHLAHSIPHGSKLDNAERKLQSGIADSTAVKAARNNARRRFQNPNPSLKSYKQRCFAVSS
jgi:hypothetical protein